MLNILHFGVNNTSEAVKLTSLFKVTPMTGVYMFGIVFIILLIAGSGRD